ncbi:uncharacterized protein LAESUDRAFT_761335 [Laetiporus sulphureus 93-53]|uniref:Uncharacterized protein n=1 Tax=Laetiporus sulphureus 93-53 TaxID=1314785 RepID=A0A165D602_9APHY|nr:uncharacterized protein LAESUDRAFT_761335 [Laetiporus sulphureus 93-53]KZT04214.1 hypothetical protein LAESUDRAFT_761335 [Laetiporus sulphureus 93-53]
MTFGFLKRARNAITKRLPYIIIVKPRSKLSEALRGHQATPFIYRTVTLQSTKVKTSGTDDHSLSSVTNSDESGGDDADWQYILPHKDNRASLHCTVHEELFRMALAPVDLMRRLQREQEITETFNLYENNDDGMSWMEEDARAQNAAIEFVSSRVGIDSYDPWSAEWQREYREGMHNSGRGNFPRDSGSWFSLSSSSSGFSMRRGINQQFDNRGEAGYPNLAIPSGQSLTSLLQGPTVAHAMLDGMDFEALEEAMESLVRLEDIQDRIAERDIKDARGDILPGCGML